MPFLKKSNNARTTINNPGGINSVDTEVIVLDATNFPSSGDFLVTLWNISEFPDPSDDPTQEIVKVTNVVGNIFTIERGQENTTAKSHTNNNAVQMLITAGHFEELENAIEVANSADMEKSVYDTDNDGIVDKAESLNDGSTGGGNEVTASEIRTHLDSVNINGINIYLVGKHGNNSFNGKNWDKAKLTFQDAIDTASSGDCIVCLDNGIYQEDITCKDGVDIYAPNAILDLESANNLILADQKTIFKKIIKTSGSGVTIGNTGIGITSILTVDEIQDSSSDFIIRNLAISSTFIIYVKKLFINGQTAVGISDAGGGSSHINININNIYLNEDSVKAIELFTSIKINGYIHNIIELGSRTGTIGLDINSGTVNLNINVLEADIAYDVESGAILNLFCNSLSGTELNDGTANVCISSEVKDAVLHKDLIDNPHQTSLSNLISKNHSDLDNKNSETDFKHVTDDEKDALDNANSPSSSNPFLTQNDSVSSQVESLFAQDLNGDLQLFEDYFGQTGLFELDESFNRIPKTTEETDLFFELDINNDIIPKEN